MTTRPPATGASTSARERAARERGERVAAAHETLGEVEAQRARREKSTASKKQKEPRASTTDPEVRLMKMADGGFRPAWNVQVVDCRGRTDRGRGRA